MADRIQLRGDTEANWISVNPVLADREIGIAKDIGKAKVGDGVSTWTALPYTLSFEDLALLPNATGNADKFLQVNSTGDGWLAQTAEEHREALELGTMATQDAESVSITNVSITSTTDATSPAAAPLKTAGGLAVAKTAFIGGDVRFAGSGSIWAIKGNTSVNDSFYDLDISSMISSIGSRAASAYVELLLHSATTSTNGRMQNIHLQFQEANGLGITIVSTVGGAPDNLTLSRPSEFILRFSAVGFSAFRFQLRRLI